MLRISPLYGHRAGGLIGGRHSYRGRGASSQKIAVHAKDAERRARLCEIRGGCLHMIPSSNFVCHVHMQWFCLTVGSLGGCLFSNSRFSGGFAVAASTSNSRSTAPGISRLGKHTTPSASVERCCSCLLAILWQVRPPVLRCGRTSGSNDGQATSMVPASLGKTTAGDMPTLDADSASRM